MSSFDNEINANEYETLASLAEDLVYRLPGCTDLMIRKTIQSVYRDFCKRTCALVSTRKIELVKGETCYMLNSRYSDCIVDCVLSVSNGSRELTNDEFWVTDRVLHVSPLIIPVNEENVYLEVVCSEIPKLGCESIPSWMVQKYGDAVNSGVLMRLMSMSGKPWSDQGQAMLEGRAYENALTETRIRHHSGGGMSSGALNFIGRNRVL